MPSRLTEPRRKALLVLLEARNNDQPVSISNHTSERFTEGDQFVYWQTAVTLERIGYVTLSRRDGREWVDLTTRGREVAAEELALELDDV